jgi:pyruvate dehydrogenase E1 component beta subunit
MRRDPRVFLMGEDVGHYGGCFAVSRGLLEEFGPERIRDTPLSESAFVGAGIGAAVGGMRPIVEVMTINFSLLALDQIVNTAATLRHMSGGQISVPVVIRMASGGGRGLAAQHSHSFEGWYAHVPGLKVATPATVADAKGLLLAALDDPDPVIVCENATLYPLQGEDVDDAPMRLGVAAVRRPGKDVSLITYGGSLPKALKAAEDLAAQGIEAEVLIPPAAFDVDTIVAAMAKTHRAVIVDEMWAASRPRSPRDRGRVRRLDARGACARSVPVPYASTARRRPAFARADRRRGGSCCSGRRGSDAQARADMTEGRVVEWLRPGEPIARASSWSSRPQVDMEVGLSAGKLEKILTSRRAWLPVVHRRDHSHRGPRRSRRPSRCPRRRRPRQSRPRRRPRRPRPLPRGARTSPARGAI